MCIRDSAYGITNEVSTQTIAYSRPGPVRNLDLISTSRVEFDAPNTGGLVQKYYIRAGEYTHGKSATKTVRSAGRHSIPTVRTRAGSNGYGRVEVWAVGIGGEGDRRSVQGWLHVSIS